MLTMNSLFINHTIQTIQLECGNPAFVFVNDLKLLSSLQVVYS